ncbi:MAG: PAS domain-containing sensor histidine kinase [Chloroflexi bacterium]|nr:PAS domain-containing sensor histidine kinase [Chloroflexota bacterium]
MILAAAYFGLCALWLALQPAEGDWRLVVSDLITLPPSLLAIATAFSLSRGTPRLDSRQQRAWAFLGAAVLAWLVGDLVWTFYEVVLHIEAPILSLADPAYLAGYGLAAIALLAYPAMPRERFSRVRIYLDLTIASGAITTLALVALIRPIIVTASASPAETFGAAVYPTADLALLLLLLIIFLTSEPRGLRSGFGFVVAGLALFLVTDVAYGYLTLQGNYHTGSPIDLGWQGGDSLIALGALYQRDHAAHPAPANDLLHRLRVGQRIQSLLPWAATIGLGWYTLLNWQMTGRADHLAMGVLVLLGLALAAREGAAAGEAELRQYAHLVNSAADPAFICDADGRLRLVNPALLAATGYAREDDLLGRSAVLLLAPGSPVIAHRGGDGRLARGERLSGQASGWSGEVIMVRRDGSEFPAYLSLRPVQGEAGSRQMLAGTAHDLSEQKRQQAVLHSAYDEAAAAHRQLETLNAQLEQKVEEKTSSLSEALARLAEQNQALQTLDQLKSEFVALVSHELRAPLTNVVGGIELLLHRPTHMATDARETLVLVQAEIQRLTQFIETILDVSALDAGRLPLLATPVAAGHIAQIIRDRFSMASAAERLRLDLPEGLPPFLADERALTSAAFHLVDNALKYAPEGEVKIEGRAEAGRVYLSISDHGAGIPPELREFVFEKFRRLDSRDSKIVYGHGLGLYVTRRLLKAMGGDICVEEPPGGGARFTLWLPAAEGEDE